MNVDHGVGIEEIRVGVKDLHWRWALFRGDSSIVNKKN